MMPKKEGISTILRCHCGYSEEGSGRFTEELNKEKKELGIVEKDMETRPVVKAKCPDCGNNEAYNWEIQTRSADEAATQFFKCLKCGHTWREYK